MENMLNQSISEEEIDILTEKIRNLKPQELDDLLDKIGFIVSTGPDARKSGEGQFKAITNKFLENMKKDFQTARSIVMSIVFESDIEKIRKEILRVSKSK